MGSGALRRGRPMTVNSIEKSLHPVGSISTNFRAVFIGRMISALSMWLALVVLSKLADLGSVGLYALAQAICIPIAEIGKMGLREVRSNDPQQTTAFHHFAALRQIAIGVGFLTMIAGALLVADSRYAALVILIYALMRCVEMMSDILYGKFQVKELMVYIGRSLCMVGPLSVFALAFGYWATGSLVVAVAGQLAAHLAVFLFYDLPNAKRVAAAGGEVLFAPWELKRIFALSVVALPLAVATCLLMVALYLPRLYVESALGPSMLAIFAALLALAMAPDRIVHALGVAVSVRLALYSIDGQISRFTSLLARLAGSVVAVCIVGTGVAVIYGEEILTAIYTAEYAAHTDLFILLVVSASARIVTSVLKFALIASRQLWWITMQNALAAVVVVAACPFLIDTHGLLGAGQALLAGFAAQLLLALVGVIAVLHTARRKVGSK